MLYNIKVLAWDIARKRDIYLDFSLKTNNKIGFSSRVLIKYLHLSNVVGYIYSYEEMNEESNYPSVIKLIDEEPLLDFEKDLIEYTAEYFKVGIYEVLKYILLNNDKVIETKLEYIEAITPPPMAKINKKEYDLYHDILKNGPVPKDYVGKKSTLNKLLKIGYVKTIFKEREKKEVVVDFLDYKISHRGVDIVRKIEESSKNIVLDIQDNKLKFEIFQELIKKVLSKGKSVLLLAKSIDLGSIQFSLLLNLFKDRVIVFDRFTSYKDRIKNMRLIKNESGYLIIGLPETIFYHIDGLETIIADVSQAREYKLFERPYINFKSIIKKKSGVNKIVFACYSPSISIMARAKKGYYDYIKAQTSDKKYELVKRSDDEILPANMINEIEECLKRGKQVLIYHSTRGYAPIYKCNVCSSVSNCPTCGSPLTYYKNDHMIKCLKCGYYQSSDDYQCTRCGGDHFKAFGYGTQMIQELLTNRFNEYKISRADSDTYKEHEMDNELSAFALGYSSILIGSQVVSANLYLPKVELLIVIDLDWILNRNEFNIEERSYNLLASLLSQVSDTGKSYLISSLINNQTLNLLTEQKYEDFYDYAINKRRLLKDPPYYNIVEIAIESTDRNRLDDVSINLVSFINKNIKDDKSFAIGPSPLRYFGSNRKYKTMIQIKYKERESIDFIIDKILLMHMPSDIILDINIDPYVE